MKPMKAVVFKGKGRIGTDVDVHCVYPAKPGLIPGHEPVGVIEEPGDGLADLYAVGERVIVGAISATVC